MPAVNLITAVPHFVSPEEHRNVVASTPSSFNDIPPVLRHREENVSVKLDPPIEGFTEQDAAQGTLYVITRCEKKKSTHEPFHVWLFSVLVFISTNGRGFQIAYPAITLHGISRSAQGSPSIYCQLDDTAGAKGAAAPATTSEGEEEEDTELREFSIFPQNPDSRTAIYTRPFFPYSQIFFTVEKIFECLSMCAALHPDQDNESDEDDAFIDSSNFEAFTGSEEQELSEVGRVRSDFVNDTRFAPY